MSFLGAIVNTLTIILGGALGVAARHLLGAKKLEKLESAFDTLIKGIALCVILIGIEGALDNENTLVVIISVALGTIIGVLLKIDGNFTRFGDFVQSKLGHGDEKSTVAQGFVSASLLFCVGAMAIQGSLDAGLSGDNSTLFAKSILDGIMALILASTLGFGVILSAVPILVYEGAITLCAGFAEPYLGAYTIAEMSCVGSLIVIGLGLNMLGVTKLKIANFLPAMFMPILLCLFIR